LRVKDLDFDAGLIVVRGGQGDKERTPLLPMSLHEEWRAHLAKVREWHEGDLAVGCGEGPLPDTLAREYPDAGGGIDAQGDSVPGWRLDRGHRRG